VREGALTLAAPLEAPAEIKRKVRAGLAKTAPPKVLGGAHFGALIGK
jgi:hypothetical protein